MCRLKGIVMAYKRSFAIALAVGLLSGLWGCGEAGKAPAGKAGLESVDPSGQKVTFWYQHSEERETALRALIDKFNSTNEYGIKVIGEHAGGHDEIYQKMLVRMQSGAQPQLVIAYRYQAQHYYQSGGVVDLMPYIYSPAWGLSAEERGDYFQEFIDQDRIKGVQVAFLPSRSMEVLYYNADWLAELGYDAPPATWVEFAEISRKAAKKPFSKAAAKGKSLGLATNVDASRLAAMVFSRNGDFINSDGSAYTLDTPQMNTSLSMLRGLMDEGAAELLDSQNAIRQAFSNGRALFVMRSSSGLPLYRADVEAGAGFTWDVAPVPDGGGQPVLNVYGASLAVGKSTPAQQLASWLFIKWFTQPAQQEVWSRKSGYFPVRRSTARDIASYFRISYGLLEHGQAEPWVVGYGAVRQMIEETMVEVLEGGDLSQALSQLEKQANATLKGQ